MVEMMVAVSILTVGLLCLGTMQLSATRTTTCAARLTVAGALAQSKLEELMLLPCGATELANGPHTENNPPEGYEVGWSVVDGTPLRHTKTIRVTVSWLEKGRTHTTELRWIKGK